MKSASPALVETSSLQAAKRPSLLPIYCMSLGGFAIGTEGFMIAPLLPDIADDLVLSLSSAAMLVTVFTLTLAISSPILTVMTAAVNRRNLLVVAMTAFAAANFVAWRSAGFTGIMAARVLLALSAGLYLPNANALVGSIVPPEKRGWALAVVMGGMTIAIALGLPLGAVVGHAFGWRWTFFGVGVLAGIAAIGLFWGVPRGDGEGVAVPGFRERIRVAGQPRILRALSVTLFWAMGAFTAYPFIASYLHATLGFESNGVSAVVFLWGVSAAVGLITGGSLNDRLGSRFVIAPALGLLAIAFLILGASAAFLSADQALVPVVVAVVVWGASVWGFHPAQMAHLIGIGGAAAAPIALSLNTSILYIGFGLGSALGAAILAKHGVADIGFAAAAIEAIGLLFFVANRLIEKAGR
jgi:MFS transporter, DHA1 family, purine base/nucleoside efflux pump